MWQHPSLALFHVQNAAQKPGVLDVEHECRSSEAIVAQTLVGCARGLETSVLEKGKEKSQKREAQLALFTFSATSLHPFVANQWVRSLCGALQVHLALVGPKSKL